MKYFLLSLLPVLFLACNQAPSSSESESDTPPIVMAETEPLLRHVVMFKFKDESSAADVQTVVDAFGALKDKIPEIHDYEWGTDNSPEGLQDGFTHCFFVTFKSEEDRATYLPHPDHQAFVEVLKPHLDKVLVVDYWTK